MHMLMEANRFSAYVEPRHNHIMNTLYTGTQKLSEYTFYMSKILVTPLYTSLFDVLTCNF